MNTTLSSHAILKAQGYLLPMQHEDGGLGYTPYNKQSFLEPTCWALLALMNLESPAVTKMIDYIRQQQNEDGGWSNVIGLPSDSMTSRAVWALASHGVDDTIIDSGISWLTQNQLPNGTWGWLYGSTGFIEPIAYAIVALRKTGYPLRASSFSTAITDLLCDDGGWNCAVTEILGIRQPSQISTTPLGMIALSMIDVSANEVVLKRAIELCWSRFKAKMISTPYAYKLVVDHANPSRIWEHQI